MLLSYEMSFRQNQSLLFGFDLNAWKSIQNIHNFILNLFQAEHNKSYEFEADETFRMKTFMDIKYVIARHNQDYAAGSVSYKLKVNEFAGFIARRVLSYAQRFQHDCRIRVS